MRLAPDYLPLKTAAGATVTVEMRRLTQVYLAMVRPAIPYHDEDYPAYRVAAHVLGGHPYSRLATALRHDEGDTYDASAIAPGSPAPELFQITTFTRTANAAEAERKMRGVLARMHREGIADAELRDAVGYLAGRRLFARQTPADVLGWLLQERRHGLPDGFFDRVADRAAELSLAEVNAFVRRFPRPGRVHERKGGLRRRSGLAVAAVRPLPLAARLPGKLGTTYSRPESAHRLTANGLSSTSFGNPLGCPLGVAICVRQGGFCRVADEQGDGGQLGTRWLLEP